MKSSRFEVLLSLNSSAEISNQSPHIICGLLSQNRILIFFIPRFSGKNKNSLGFLILSANTHLKLIYVKYWSLIIIFFSCIEYTRVCPSYFTYNLLPAAFYLICSILIE
jgi:hypothetical protein